MSKCSTGKSFKGIVYPIVEDDETSVVFLEGKSVMASCIEYGNHALFETDYPPRGGTTKKAFLKPLL